MSGRRWLCAKVALNDWRRVCVHSPILQSSTPPMIAFDCAYYAPCGAVLLSPPSQSYRYADGITRSTVNAGYGRPGWDEA